jgi:predicted transcriptional regulator
MTFDLTDDQIALLCAIGELDPTKQTDDKRRDLKKLISGGFVEEAESQAGYKLTAKGAEFLGKRGAGLNEA